MEGLSLQDTSKRVMVLFSLILLNLVCFHIRFSFMHEFGHDNYFIIYLIKLLAIEEFEKL